MTKYIDPCSDFGFKKIFGEEANKEILKAFLNSLLPPEREIQSLSFKNIEQTAAADIERKAFFDIYCIGKNGEKFIVEMQRTKAEYFKDRTLFYLTYPIREDAKKNEWSYELNPIYFIGVLDFLYEPSDKAQVVRTATLKDHDNQPFYDKLNIIYLQLPAFNKTLGELESATDKWLYFLKNLEDLNEIPFLLNEPVFQQAFETAEYARLHPDQQMRYDKARLDPYVIKQAQERDLKEAQEKGLAEGKAKGLAEGKAEGLAEGKAEVAREMKKEGLSFSMISKITGLTEQEINAL